MRGVVVRIPVDKDRGVRLGFMFVRGDDDYIERFVHRTGLQQTTKSFESINEGDAVEFTPLDDAPKGPRAIEVRVL